jgi:uncharacterized membrane protein
VLSTDGSGQLSWEDSSPPITNAVKLYKLNFNKAASSPQTHPVTLPINSEILKVTVAVDSTLTGSAGQVIINGLSPILLAEEGVHYLTSGGQYITEYTGFATIAIMDMIGNIEYTQSGSGTGSGRIFVEVGVPI